MDAKRELEIKEQSIKILTALSELAVENMTLKAILDSAHNLQRLPKDWKKEAESLKNSTGAIKIRSNFAPIIASIQEALNQDRVLELLAAVPISHLLQ